MRGRKQRGGMRYGSGVGAGGWGWGGWGWGDSYDYNYPWYYPAFLYERKCKLGCGEVGNGVIGCINPGYSYDRCLFSSDCVDC